MLVRGVVLLARHKDDNSDTTMFVLRDLFNNVVLAWPAKPRPEENIDELDGALLRR